jgi:protein tyrosine phosphatase (PTP) superfamily phosphohydrolase (DUF442 family)
MVVMLVVLSALSATGCGGENGGDQDSAGGQDTAKDKAADGSKDAGKDGRPTALPDQLAPAKLGELSVQQFGEIYMAGQPDEAALQAAKQAGVLHVVNLRSVGENAGFDEGKIVADLGMRFHNPGFSSPDELTEFVFLRVRDLLSSKANRPMLLHCASANRVGAVWLAHRVLDDGLPYEKALAEAKQVGLRSKALEAVAKAYIDSKPCE